MSGPEPALEGQSGLVRFLGLQFPGHGLVVIETLFHYRGIGALIYSAARAKDFPMLEAGVLTVGLVYALASVLADLASAALNPRLRAAGT